MKLLKRDWRGYNGGQGTKDDLLNVCEILDSCHKGMQVIYNERDFTVPELRLRMRVLLAMTAAKFDFLLTCASCKGKGKHYLLSEATHTKCLACGGTGQMPSVEHNLHIAK